MARFDGVVKRTGSVPKSAGLLETAVLRAMHFQQQPGIFCFQTRLLRNMHQADKRFLALAGRLMHFRNGIGKTCGGLMPLRQKFISLRAPIAGFVHGTLRLG